MLSLMGFIVTIPRYVKLRVSHAPGMPGTFPLPPQVSDPGMHDGTCVTHVPWCMQGSLSGTFLCRWWGIRSLHSRLMRNPQFYISGKRPMRNSSPRHFVRSKCLSMPTTKFYHNDIRRVGQVLFQFRLHQNRVECIIVILPNLASWKCYITKLSVKVYVLRHCQSYHI